MSKENKKPKNDALKTPRYLLCGGHIYERLPVSDVASWDSDNITMRRRRTRTVEMIKDDVPTANDILEVVLNSKDRLIDNMRISRNKLISKVTGKNINAIVQKGGK